MGPWYALRTHPTEEEGDSLPTITLRFDLWDSKDKTMLIPSRWSANFQCGRRIRNAIGSHGQGFRFSLCMPVQGLGAPVGSVLLSSGRQSVLLIDGGRCLRRHAPSGYHCRSRDLCIENHVDRLTQDHDHARMLAESINNIPAFQVDLDSVATNMVYVHSEKFNPHQLQESLSERGIDVLTIDDHTIRLVTHLHINQDDVGRTISAFESIS